MTARSVRVRYAPSPTGIPHIGNLRTALFDWLYARHSGGSFILRVEDTDRNRLVEGAVEAILESLEWLGIEPDEGPPPIGGAYGPYFQSERLGAYHDAAERLIAGGRAYRCYCSPERLDQVRKEQQARKEPPRYDRRCRWLSPDERGRLHHQAGGRCVVRFAMLESGETSFHDLLRGILTFDNALQDDPVILKTDGFPTYHLANVVDDHDMAISHVLRGEEWIPSAPKHVQLYDALGWSLPIFVHTPLILGTDRSKLSKRHGATTVLGYRDEGYLPEAVFNFMALLGWSKDESTEIMTRQEMIDAFTLERLGVNPAVFNIEKLQWMNGVYIRQLDPDDLTARLLPFLDRGLPSSVPRPLDRDYIRGLVPLIQERLKVLTDGPELLDFFLVDRLSFDPLMLIPKSADAPAALRSLDHSRERLAAANWEHDALEAAGRQAAADLGMKAGPVFTTLRVALTGRTAAPPLFETMLALGRDRAFARIDQARQHLRLLAQE